MYLALKYLNCTLVVLLLLTIHGLLWWMFFLLSLISSLYPYHIQNCHPITFVLTISLGTPKQSTVRKASAAAQQREKFISFSGYVIFLWKFQKGILDIQAHRHTKRLTWGGEQRAKNFFWICFFLLPHFLLKMTWWRDSVI